MSRKAHAPCRFRRRIDGRDCCYGPEMSCVYCFDRAGRADRETNAPEARPPRKRTAGKRDRRDRRPFEDS